MNVRELIHEYNAAVALCERLESMLRNGEELSDEIHQRVMRAVVRNLELTATADSEYEINVI